jgi:hypothetical protein
MMELQVEDGDLPALHEFAVQTQGDASNLGPAGLQNSVPRVTRSQHDRVTTS